MTQTTTWKTLLCTLLLGACLLSLCACPEGEPSPGSDAWAEGAYLLEQTEEGAYFCTETGITYRQVQDTYLPGRLANRPYAAYRPEGGAAKFFFKLGPDSAEQYLVEADPETMYPHRMYVADGYDLPDLAEMDPDEVWICGAEAISFWAEANIIDKMLYADRVDRVVAAWSGFTCELPLGQPEIFVQLIFRSPFYTEFYYFCTYYSFGEDACYLYESASGRCVKVPDDLFDGYEMTDES